MTYQTFQVPNVALRPAKRVLERFPRPKLKGLPGGYLGNIELKVIQWPKLPSKSK